MNFIKTIEGAFALLNSKGVYRQAQLYSRGEAVYAKYGGRFIRLGIGGATSSVNVKWVEFDAGETAIINERNGAAPQFAGERKHKVAAE